MGKDRRGLQLLDGFGPAVIDSPSSRLNGIRRLPRKDGGAPTHLFEWNKEDPANAFQTTEQRLSARLADRSRLSHDLDYSLLFLLYAVGLYIQPAQQAVPDTNAAPERVVGQINQLITEIRKMTCGLGAGIVQEFDLEAELLALRAAYRRIGVGQITLALHRAAIEVLTQEEARGIFQIVREGLSNCVRHAQAAHTAVSIRKRGNRIRVSITDDGVGFVSRDGRSRGYGLALIESRAHKIGGSLRIQSEEGRGTRLIVEFSLEPLLASV